MNRGAVQRIVAVVDAQEACGLLEGLVAQAWYLTQFFAIRERAVGISVLDDVFRQHAVKARHPREQRRRSRIDVHAHRVDAIFDRGIERARERALIHVVLVLADADRLGVYFYQLGEWVLQAPGDGHGAAQAHVQLGKFSGGKCRRRINRGTGFADDDFVQLPFRHLRSDQLDHLGGELVGFAASGAVADGDQLNVMLHGHARQRRQRSLPVVARLVRINGGRLKQLTRGIDDRDFAAGAYAGVDAKHRLGAGGRRQQQLTQIAAEYFNRFGFRRFAQLRQQLGADMRMRFAAPGPLADLGQPLVGATAAVFDAEMRGDHRDAWMRYGGFDCLAQTQFDLQHIQALTAEQRERAMRGDGAYGLGIGVVVAEFFFLGRLLAFHHSGSNDALLPQARTQFGEEIGGLGKTLAKNLACAVESGLGIGNIYGVATLGSRCHVYVLSRLLMRIERGIGE